MAVTEESIRKLIERELPKVTYHNTLTPDTASALARTIFRQVEPLLVETRLSRLLHLVATMREKQINYFKTRDSSRLPAARKAEKEVDDLLHHEMPPPAPAQQNLF